MAKKTECWISDEDGEMFETQPEAEKHDRIAAFKRRVASAEVPTDAVDAMARLGGYLVDGPALVNWLFENEYEVIALLAPEILEANKGCAKCSCPDCSK